MKMIIIARYVNIAFGRRPLGQAKQESKNFIGMMKLRFQRKRLSTGESTVRLKSNYQCQQPAFHSTELHLVAKLEEFRHHNHSPNVNIIREPHQLIGVQSQRIDGNTKPVSRYTGKEITDPNLLLAFREFLQS